MNNATFRAHIARIMNGGVDPVRRVSAALRRPKGSETPSEEMGRARRRKKYPRRAE